MNYVIDMYLNYLDEAEDYEAIYHAFTEHFILTEAPPITSANVGGMISKQQDTLNTLIQHKTSLMAKHANPETIAAIDAQIKAAGASLGNIKNMAANLPPVATSPTIPNLVGDLAPSAKAQAQLAADPRALIARQKELGGIKQTYTDKKSQAAMDAEEKSLSKAADDTAKGAAPKPEPPVQEPGILDTAKEKAADVGATAQDLYTGASGAVSGGTTSALTKAGVDPTLAQGLGQSLGSPLGMAALGGAAAFGGYKLYKRFLSKSARACTGYSGSAKTGCMKSYMNAKKGQATVRGTEVAAAT